MGLANVRRDPHAELLKREFVRRVVLKPEPPAMLDFIGPGLSVRHDGIDPCIAQGCAGFHGVTRC